MRNWLPDDFKDLISKLGGTWSYKRDELHALCHCPFHDDRTTPALSITYRNGAILANCRAGCLDAYKKLIDAGYLLSSGRPLIKAQLEDEPDYNLEQAKVMWGTSRPIKGTEGERYLNWRQIDLNRLPSLDHVLKWRENCYWERRYSDILGDDVPLFHNCMVARFTNVNGEVKCLHRTALKWTRDGWTTERKFLGPSKATVCRLAEPTDTLLIGEGIETVLSAMELYNLPGWSCGYADNLAQFPVLDIPTLIIAVDNDPPGKKAAASCTQRWRANGRSVEWILPTTPKHDLNDVLKGSKNGTPSITDKQRATR